MVAKHFENSEWGFLNKNAKRRKKGEIIKCQNVLHKNFIDRKLGHYSYGSFGSICKNLTYCVGKHYIWAML